MLIRWQKFDYLYPNSARGGEVREEVVEEEEEEEEGSH